VTTTAFTTILGPTDAFTLLTRSWRLFKHLWKPSLQLLLVPATLTAGLQTLFAIGYGLFSLNPAFFWWLFLVGGVILVLGSIGGYVVWLLAGVGLSRFYYGQLVGQPKSVLQIAESVLEQWFYWVILFGMLLVVLMVTSLGIFGILALLGMVTFSGVGVLGGLIGILGGSNQIVLAVFVVLAMVVLVLGFLAFLLAGLTCQTTLCFFPLTVAANSPSKTLGTLMGHYFSAYRWVIKYPTRFLTYGLLTLLMITVLSLVISFPVQIWGIMEGLWKQMDQRDNISPLYFLVSNLFSTLINLVILPYTVAALTLLLYDLRCRDEGLDLSLRWAQLNPEKDHDM